MDTMKSYIITVTGAAVCLLIEAVYAMILYAALSRITDLEHNALWIGCCILAGCLFIGAMIVALVGSIPKSGK